MYLFTVAVVSLALIVSWASYRGSEKDDVLPIVGQE